MKEAAFSLFGYRFDKVSIELGNHTASNVSVHFDTKGAFEGKASNFELWFSMQAFDEGNQSNPYVNVECTATFRFDPVVAFEEIPDYFYANAIAILFPYLRAYVSLITVQANVPPIILPTMNLSSLAGALRKNTSQK